jgi:hypothetical protein
MDCRTLRFVQSISAATVALWDSSPCSTRPWPERHILLEKSTQRRARGPVPSRDFGTNEQMFVSVANRLGGRYASPGRKCTRAARRAYFPRVDLSSHIEYRTDRAGSSRWHLCAHVIGDDNFRHHTMPRQGMVWFDWNFIFRPPHAK